MTSVTTHGAPFKKSDQWYVTGHPHQWAGIGNKGTWLTCQKCNERVFLETGYDFKSVPKCNPEYVPLSWFPMKQGKAIRAELESLVR
jgi:hypothetical protein